MKIYAISDLHLSLDPRIEKPMDVFGPAWADHAVRLKRNWEAVVSPGDLVLVPGDISWGLRLDEALADLEWIGRLPGTKVITKGNHDLWWTTARKLEGLIPGVTFLQNHAYAAGGGLFVCGTRGWICPGTEGFDAHDEKIYTRERLRLGFSLDEAMAAGAEEIIAMLHYPPTNDRFEESGFQELLEQYPVKTCVYGHLHGRENFKHGFEGVRNGIEYRLVSLDRVGASPVRLR